MKYNDEISDFLKNKYNGKTFQKAEGKRIEKILSVSRSVIPDISQFEKDNIRTNIMAKIDAAPANNRIFSRFLRWGVIGSAFLVLLFFSMFYLKNENTKDNAYYSYLINSTIEEYCYTSVTDSTNNISDRDLIKYMKDNPGIIDYFGSL